VLDSGCTSHMIGSKKIMIEMRPNVNNITVTYGYMSQSMTPQNRHLADHSDHATIYMMSLWKRTTKRLVHVQHARDAGGIKLATVTQVHDGTHKQYIITTKTPRVKNPNIHTKIQIIHKSK
jgi:hypothetical protein